MKLRLHLFEWEDQPWFPQVLRAGQMAYLRFMIARLGIYRPAVPLLAEVLRRSGQPQLLELGAGAGGSAAGLLAALRRHPAAPPGLQVLLTDLYPQPAAWAALTHQTQGTVQGHPAPVDARDVPPELPGVRVLFSVFHHFAPPQAEAVLRSAVAAGQGVAIVEGAGKSWGEVALALTALPLAQLLLTPFFRPFRLSNLLFTYLLPLIPLATVWDGVVSVLRLYPVPALRALAARADPAGRYQWQAGQRRHWWGGRITYLVGWPAAGG